MAVAIKVYSDGYKRVEHCDFDELLSFYTAEALKGFVERGGAGLKEAIRDCIDSSIRNGMGKNIDKEE